MTMTEAQATTAAPLAPIDTDIGVVLKAAGRALTDLDLAEVTGLFRTHGAVLLRGFPHDRAAFVAFSGRLTDDFSNYQGGGLRFAALDREAIDGINFSVPV